MNLTLGEIASSVRGRCDGSPSLEARGYSIDTRSIQPGQLYFAIKGPRFDGHDYVDDAARRGAVGAVVSRNVENHGLEFPCIRVESTLDALQELAQSVRRRWGGRIVAITGSVGKTTTKEMVAALLGEQYRVLRSVGNMNNEYGLPLCLLRAEAQHDIAVLEMGMSAPGEIRKLASIAEPNEGVITNVNRAHLEFFESIDQIAEAKAELLAGLVGERRAYLNYDDSRVRAMAQHFDGQIVTFGVRSVAAFRASRIKHTGLEGVTFSVRHARRSVDFVMPLLGVHNVSNALAAISVAATLGVGWADMQRAVGRMAPGRMRGAVLRFSEGFTVIDDCYNSSPKGLTEMIRTLARLGGFKRRILVAGEMLELGVESRKLHADCGRDAARAGVDLIVGVGANAAALIEGAADGGVDEGRLRFVPNAEDAGELLAPLLRKGDLVLMKASRGVGLEEAVQFLRRRFATLEP